MVCTTVTTICGIWFAYGEPPNLIMRANLRPHLNDAFFLRYCLPAAVASYVVVARHLRKRLGRRRIDLDGLDVLDANVSARPSDSPPRTRSSTAAARPSSSSRCCCTSCTGVNTAPVAHRLKEPDVADGFFDQLQPLLQRAVERVGPSHVAAFQLAGSTGLLAILDNNIVADFASRALRDFDRPLLHLFALAQIAGYAPGGCWTQIGSAQSVVAFAFISREIDYRYTPIQWIRDITPLIVEMLLVLAAIVYGEGMLLSGTP